MLHRVATAGSKEAKELEKVKKTFEELYRESKAEKNTAEGGVSTKYSLSANAESELHKALYDKNYRDEVLLRDETPPIMLSQKGVKNHKMVMNASHIRENIFTEEEARKLGLKIDEHTHYHGIGEKYFLKIIDSLDNVKEAYRGTKNASDSSRRENYFLLVSEFKDENGNTINVPVYIEKGAFCNRVYLTSNKIATVFGREDFREYINRQIREKNLIRINNKSNTSSEGDALIAPAYESTALTNSISDSPENVKQKGDFSLSKKDTTPKKYGDYAVYGEDVMLEGEAKPTGKAEFTAPMRADLKNDLLSRSSKSFGITKPGDYVQVQRQVFDTLEKEGFFSDEGSRSRTVTNRDSSMQVEINKKGIKETFNYDNYGKFSRKYKGVKLETVRMLPQMIENGKLVSDDVDNYHNEESSVKFAYIESEVEIDGQSISVKIDIKKSPQKNKFWVHSINIKEKVNGLPVNDSKSLERDYIPTDSTESISNTDENVNSVDNGAEQILGESQLRTAEPKKNNIRAAWKSFLRNFVSKGAEVETYALKGKNRAVGLKNIPTYVFVFCRMKPLKFRSFICLFITASVL